MERPVVVPTPTPLLPPLLLLLLLLAIAATNDASALAYSSAPPVVVPIAAPIFMGIGSMLFRPRNTRYVKSNDYDGELLQRRRRRRQRERMRWPRGGGDGMDEDGVEEDALTLAGRFFVDAFWRGKAGGPDELSPYQSMVIERQQIAEFRKRYGASAGRRNDDVGGASGSVWGGGGRTRLPGNYATRAAGGGGGGGSSSPPSSRTRGRRAELVLCVADVGDRGDRNPGGGGGSTTAIIGCAGIEIDRVRKMDGYDTKIIGPVMSNLAIGREYRRRGLAENLVIAVEDIASREWGYDVCYLYVEKRNTKARKLYEKLGYEVIWEDDTATTLLPARGGGDGGGLISGRTTIVCMRKDLAEGRGMMGMKNIALSFGSLFSRR